MPRYDRLEGIGRIRVYDNGGRTLDRYLVLFEDMETWEPASGELLAKPKPYGERQALSMSPDPSYPLGVSQWDYARPPDTWGGTGRMRWRRIPFESLPENVREHVIARATEVPE